MLGFGIGISHLYGLLPDCIQETFTMGMSMRLLIAVIIIK